MRYRLSLLIASLLSASALAPSAASRPLPYHSIAAEFPRFVDQTASLPAPQRVTAFKRRFGRLFRPFYKPEAGQPPARFDQSIAEALASFPAIRARYEIVERRFPSDFAAAVAHFRQQFPNFAPALPIWLLHSLGRMDGGTRTMHGQTYLIFGADMIARLHGDGSIGPFLDHELFHVENNRWFKDCHPETTIWCSLWQEGTAVYAASVMNPGASDHLLMLDLPRPIRHEVDARWRDAVCRSSADLDRSDAKTYSSYFRMSDTAQPFPHRWGYYLGYRLVQRIGHRLTLGQIDRLDQAAAHRILTQELAAMAKEVGGCDGQDGAQGSAATAR